MEFADATGRELFALLMQRGHERLPEPEEVARFMALLAAALIPVAEILRNPVEHGRDAAATADKMVDAAARQLRALLQAAVDARLRQ